MQGPLLSQAAQFNAAGPPGIPYSGMNPYASVNPASQLGPIGSAVPAHSIATLTGTCMYKVYVCMCVYNQSHTSDTDPALP